MIKLICDKCGLTLTVPNDCIEKLEKGYVILNKDEFPKFTLLSGTDYLLCENCQKSWSEFMQDIVKQSADKFVGRATEHASDNPILKKDSHYDYWHKVGCGEDMKQEPIQRKLEGCRKGGKCEDCADKYVCEFSALREM